MNQITNIFPFGEAHSIRYLFALFIYKLEENFESEELSYDYFVFIAGNAWYIQDSLDIILPSFDSIIELKLMSSNNVQEIVKWCKPAKILNDYCASINKNFEFICLMQAHNKLITQILEMTENGNDDKIVGNCNLIVGQLYEAYLYGVDIGLLRTTITLPICDYANEFFKLDEPSIQISYQESTVQPIRNILIQLQKICESDQNNKKYVDEVLTKVQSLQIIQDLPNNPGNPVYPVYPVNQVNPGNSGNPVNPGNSSNPSHPGYPVNSKFVINKNYLVIDRTVPKYADTKNNFQVAVFSGTYQNINIIAKQYSSFTAELKKDIDTEISIYEKLSDISSPENSFIKYYGTHYEGHSIVLIMESYPINLEMKIQQMRDENKHIDEQMFLKVAYKLVNSYSQLRDLNIIHRDVKSSNIVVDNTFDTRIIDFGSSIVQNQDVTLRTDKFRAVGTEYFLAPEVDQIVKGNQNKQGTYNLEKADVYSLGLVFIQLITLWNITDPNFHKNYAGTYVDQCLQHLSIPTRSFLKMMLTVDPSSRPTFKQILPNIPFDPKTLSRV
jgi:hypothetical protein